MRNEWSAYSNRFRAGILTLLSLALLLAVVPAYSINGNVGPQAYLPTTFTAEGWAFYCNPNNGIIPGGMVYNRFPIAFSQFKFYGYTKSNELRVGDQRTFIRYIGKTSCLTRLCILLDTPCEGCGRLQTSLECPWTFFTPEGTFLGGGCLAVETIVLLMNVAYNDMRVMPRTPGVDLECYRIASGPLKGKTVAEVFNIANQILAGKAAPCWFGLVSCEQLVFYLRQINANYEFIDYNTFIDRGFLIPDKPFNPFAKPHCPTVPMQCKPVY